MWLQTGEYTLEGLIWLIVMGVVFVIALVALIMAGSAISQARAAKAIRMYQPADTPSDYTVTSNAVAHDDMRSAEAFKTLDERYAKGEITREEYMQRQTDLARQNDMAKVQ